MFYFIPAWYESDTRRFSGDITPWYRNRQEVEFDDTISQIQMFSKEKEEFEVITLNFNPNLQKLKLTEALNQVKQTSIFDVIQEIPNDFERTPIDYRNLKWPKDVSFYHNSFRTYVMRGNKKYAIMEYDSLGRISKLEIYDENEVLIKEYVFDMRGFLSNYYDHSTFEIKYLNLKGKWVIKENQESHQIHVNPLFENKFQKLIYENIDELIEEKLTEKLTTLSSDDVLVIGAHQNNFDIMTRVSSEAKRVYSFFGDRQAIASLTSENIETLNQAAFVVVDTSEKKAALEEMLSHVVVKFIPPFDSRLRLGHSQQIRMMKVYLNIDGLSDEELSMALKRIIKKMMENRGIELTLGTYNASDGSVDERLNRLVPALIEEYGDEEELVFRMNEQKEANIEFNEDIADGNMTVIEKRAINVFKISSQRDLINELDTTRLIIDLNAIPDTYLTIAAISAGIPQINASANIYVQNKKNGIQINSYDELYDALDYYLEGLNNWNQAMMYAVNEISKYSSESIVAQFKELVGEN